MPECHPLFERYQLELPVPRMLGLDITFTQSCYKSGCEVDKLNAKTNVLGTRLTVDRVSGFAP